MNRYTPLWSGIVDSSLWREEDYVVKVFMTMLAKKDMDDVVRGNAYNIGTWANKTERETLKALEILSLPDDRRIEPQPHEGRRIQKHPEGWLILNGKHYREQMIKANRREYKRVKQREYRSKPLPGEEQAIRHLEAGNVEGFEHVAATARMNGGNPV